MVPSAVAAFDLLGLDDVNIAAADVEDEEDVSDDALDENDGTLSLKVGVAVAAVAAVAVTQADAVLVTVTSVAVCSAMVILCRVSF